MTELAALRAVDFNWTLPLQDVWTVPSYDVPALHAEMRTELTAQLLRLTERPQVQRSLGTVVVGSGGTGKTHLLSCLRAEAMRRRVAFVLVDMTDVHDFWDTVCLGYLKSLEQPCDEEHRQYELLLARFIATLNPRQSLRKILDRFRTAKTVALAKDTKAVISTLAKKYRNETMHHQDMIRALIALNSEDFDISSVGHTYLQGHAIEEEDRKALGFRQQQRPARHIVEGLSWMMSLSGPVVLALDQLDPIVTQLHIAGDSPAGEAKNEEIRVARMIIEGIAGGLSALYDVTQRTLMVISCLEKTWGILCEEALSTHADRFQSPRILRAIGDSQIARSIVESRLRPGYQQRKFKPPYASWPFSQQAFEKLKPDLSVRRLLQLCGQHRVNCLRAGQVTEVEDFSTIADGREKPVRPSLPPFDAEFEKHRQEADPSLLLEEKKDDERLAPLLQSACHGLLRENPPPPSVDGVVEESFPGGNKTRPLHVRVRLIHHNEQDREEHYCLRALQWGAARAFQSRLTAAMTQSGIDRRLKFRRLAIIRSLDLPGGKVTKQLLDKFREAGGRLVCPSDDDLRTLHAIHKLREKHGGDMDFDRWLAKRKPISRSQLMGLAFPELCDDSGKGPPSDGDSAGHGPDDGGSSGDVGPDSQGSAGSAGPETGTSDGGSAGTEQTSADDTDDEARVGSEDTADRQPGPSGPKDGASTGIPLGYRWLGNAPGPAVAMPLQLLERHTVVLAGAGSGKTVLVRRLVEEAALLGIPSIVIDCANDLVTLGEPWPKTPAEHTPQDTAKAKRYFASTDVAVWTPGRDAGNALRLEPLPDFRAVADSADELNAAVEMACQGLRELVASGTSASAQNKVGVLSRALRCFAEQGSGSLDAFINLLAELPPDAGLGIKGEDRLAREMSDRLKVERETNILLRSKGASLDPATLFGDDHQPRRPRVSVINFVGLRGLEAQRQFLNQLAMTLFAWIKRHPAPSDRTLRGLLVIDEAKDFLPGQSKSICKESIMRLTAQARKYHLGIVLATQNPREIDNKIIGNCSTQYYGKANSKANIDTLRSLIAPHGASGHDIGSLPKGRFYVYNADANLRAPTKIQVPLCLSYHPPNPLTEEEVLRKAVASRKRLNAESRSISKDGRQRGR